MAQIADGAAKRAGYQMLPDIGALCGRYAACGRDAVNMVQMAAGLAQMEQRTRITQADMEWVITSGHYPARPDQRAAQ